MGIVILDQMDIGYMSNPGQANKVVFPSQNHVILEIWTRIKRENSYLLFGVWVLEWEIES